MKLFTLSLAGLSLCLIAATAEASITMQPSYIEAVVYDGVDGSGGSYPSFTGSTTPTLDPLTHTHTTLNAVDGNSYSNNDIDWYVNGGGQTVLSLGMDHKRAASIDAYSFAYAQEGYLNFHADASDPYDITGYYNATDSGDTSGAVVLQAFLYDVTLGYIIVGYGNYQSYNTLNEQLTLGGTGGEYNDSSNLSGNLIAGHDYAFYGLGELYAYDVDSGATAKGNVTLTIGATPEPLSLMVWGGLIAATVINTGRRTRS